MSKKNYWLKRKRSFQYAFKGLKFFVTTEPNALIHLAFTLFVIIAGFFFNISVTEWSLLFICCALVLGSEAFNTAIEKLADIILPEQNTNIGLVKDIAAAAVLITSLFAATVGLLIFLPKLFTLLQ